MQCASSVAHLGAAQLYISAYFLLLTETDRLLSDVPESMAAFELVEDEGNA